MELIRYLEQNFFTREQLLAASGASEQGFARWQAARMMPGPSYVLGVQLGCDSIFGRHEEAHTVEYYAKGYVEWVRAVAALDGEAAALAMFAARYRQHLSELAATAMAPLPAALYGDEHIRSEWLHFLHGTYGLCTVSGLPEDIAAKEAAIAVIRETEDTSADQSDRQRHAVAVLDAASAAFAPHERDRSSRRKYVDALRARRCG